MENVANDPYLTFLDLILIPVDEWSSDVQQNIAASDGASQSTPLEVRRSFDLDGISSPKNIETPIRSFGESLFWYPNHTNKWPSFLPNKEQRLWMVTAAPHFHTTTAFYRQSEHEACHSIQMWRNARYLSMRGSR